MTRRNAWWLAAAGVVSLVCQTRQGLGERGHFSRLVTHSMAEIEANYLEPIDSETLFDGAMTGMMAKLDEYSAYLDERNYGDIRTELDQQFGGIGIQVVLDDETGVLKVMTPLVGTPAFLAGIRAGDEILSINGESTVGFKLDDALLRLRGKPGEKVRVGIRHPSEEPIEIELTRAVIETETVLGDSRLPDQSWDFFLSGTDHVGYVRISPMFSERTVEELTAALEWLKKRNAKALILDLRSNPGGLLDAGIGVCNLFVSKGRIVSTRGRTAALERTYDADGNAICTNLPLVVLVNHYSASASEIVAACLQDHARAQIVGERTWGKGSVQDVIPLDRGDRALKLTTASYWRPSGQNIHRGVNDGPEKPWGVSPNPGCEVKIDDAALEALLRRRRDRDIVRHPDQAATSTPTDVATAQTPWSDDSQLARAIEVALQTTAAVAAPTP